MTNLPHIVNFLSPNIKVDVIICLGAMLNKRNELTWNLESRVNKAIEIYQEHPESQLVLMGGKSYLDNTERPAESEVMLQYIKKHYSSIDFKRIHLDTVSTSTTEQLYKIKIDYLLGQSLRSLAVVSDEFHILPTSVVANKMIGNEFTIYFVGSEINLGGRYREIIERLENDYYKKTREDYAKFKEGDHESIMQWYKTFKSEMVKSVKSGGDWLKPVKV